MAAYHFTAKILARSGGARSAVRAAAYRAGEKLYDARVGEFTDYTCKRDMYEARIFAPEGAPAWVFEREQLWNRVEARENRKDAQLAQELEINLPREFSAAENWSLITDWVKRDLVANGRVCDVAMHCATASDGEAHTHAHILMPMRLLDGDRFGDKHPDVDRKTFFQNRHRIEELRESWCEFVRERAAERGIDLGPDWDHRSLEARDIPLEPQPKIGATAARIENQKRQAERVTEYLETVERNGAVLLLEPRIALRAVTAHASTFTDEDLARWIHRHSTEEQFGAILAKARAEAVAVGTDRDGRQRYSTADMIALERTMAATADQLASRRTHIVREDQAERMLVDSGLSAEQMQAARHILAAGDLASLVGFAGAGKSTMLAKVRAAYEAAGYTVRGGALSGIAAQNLEQGSGITSRTLASWAHAWEGGHHQLSSKDVLIIDESGMIGSRQLSNMLSTARAVGAKVVLVGDAEQLQAIEAGAAFRAITDRTGAAELSTVHRQHQDWQREATRELATGQTAAALTRYAEAGAISAAKNAEMARASIVHSWLTDHVRAPEASQLILAHTRADVQTINDGVREQLKRMGKVSGEVDIDTARGARSFGVGDRLLFLKNDRALGVKNGTLGWVEKAGGNLVVRTDDGRQVAFDPLAYNEIDHGYAVTIHKSQGVTVDRSYVLASRGFDRHLTYVALSRHRAAVSVVYSQAEFADSQALTARLERERAKDTTLDYAEEFREVRGFARSEALQPTAPAVDPTEQRRREIEAILKQRRTRDRSRDPDLSR